MSTIIFVVSLAAAISIGTVGGIILMMKLMSTKKGKQAVKDYAKEMTDLTYDILKDNMANTKRWEELMTNTAE